MARNASQMDIGKIGVRGEALPALGAGPIDLARWFDADRRDQPMELEIGSGKGTFAVTYAAARPEVNLIGLEWAGAYWRYAADRCRRHGLNQVRLVQAEAAMFVRQYVPDHCFRQVHLYHPDPWPKTRHHKRRLIQQPFLSELHRVLQPCDSHDPQRGLVRITTDHADYFAWIEQAVEQAAAWFERLPFESPMPTAEGELVGTNFERKYREAGRQFHGMILRRC